MYGDKELACPNCGVKNRSIANFCKNCGSILQSICSVCKSPLELGSRYCTACGQSITPMPEEKGIKKWERRPEDFALRVEVEDIASSWFGIFKSVTVEHGTKALFLQGGRFCGELPPGTYDAGGLKREIADLNFAEKTTVIFVDVSDISLDFNIKDLRTKEDFKVGVKGRVKVNLNDPNTFFTNFMKSKDLITTNDIEDAFSDEIRNILQSKIKQYSYEDLYGNLDLKKEIEQDFTHRMSEAYERNGLNLIYLSYLDYDENEWDPLIKQKGLLTKDLIDKRNKIKYQTQIELIDKERSDLEKRVKERLTSEKMHQLRTENDIRIFINELDKDRILSDFEKEDLIRILKEYKEDAQLARERTLEKAKLEHKIAIETIQVEYSMGMDRKQLEHKHDLARKELQFKVDAELLEKRVAEAKAGKLITYMELYQKWQRMLLELDKLRKELERTEKQFQIDMEMRIREQELKTKIETLKATTGMTPEQIIATLNPEKLAEVLPHQYRALKAEELNKTLLSMKKEEADRLLDFMKTAVLGRQGGASVIIPGSSGLGGSLPVIVQPPSIPTLQTIKCLCGAENPIGSLFCNKCGRKIGM